MDFILQYIFNSNDYTGERIISIFAVYAAHKGTKAIFLFLAIGLELMMIFVRCTTAVCLTIGLRLAAALMSFTRE
jgi:hypothetical protein